MRRGRLTLAAGQHAERIPIGSNQIFPPSALIVCAPPCDILQSIPTAPCAALPEGRRCGIFSLDDWSTDELRALIDEAAALKAEYLAGGNRPILKGKVLAMIFQKPSLRTRVSFDVGMQHLGGSAVMLGQNEIGLGKREAISDIARVLSGMVHGIMARVFDHNHVVEPGEVVRRAGDQRVERRSSPVSGDGGCSDDS